MLAPVLAILGLLQGALASSQPTCAEGRDVIVHLFSWKWTDIADECEFFLGPKGFCGVQVSPPNEHREIRGEQMRPWFERYQPASYRLESRSGTRAQFLEMLQRCHAANVRIYVDMVINHMLESISGTDLASGGSVFNATSQEFPSVPYGPEDFNGCENCPADCNINNYQDAAMVRNCRFNNLLDLKLSSNTVRQRVADYFNDLLSIGVAGFRIDAAKHMWPADLQNVFSRVQNLSTQYFPPNTRPFIYQEVIDFGSEPIRGTEYTPMGRVTEFRFGSDIGKRFRRQPGWELKYLREMGPAWGWLNSGDAIVFVDNHDNQRGHGAGGSDILTHLDPRPYRMATAFNLAHPYGFKRIMSSYQWETHWQGPPNNTDYSVKNVTINPDGTCGNGWICEHRWRQVFNMAKFHSVVGNAPLVFWQDMDNDNQFSHGNQIAFAREGRGFIVINNHNETLSARLRTTLPEGTYCDVISGDMAHGICTAKSVYVSADSFADFYIPDNEVDPMIALHIEARLGDGPVEPTRPPPVLRRTVVLMYFRSVVGQDVFLGGGIDHRMRPGCTTTAETSFCALEITHSDLGNSSHYDKYNAWKVGDRYLDWYGAEPGQGSYEGIPASGSPTVWTTNDTSHPGYKPINTFGEHYWLLDVTMDCSLDEKGWFDVRGYLRGSGWEPYILPVATCDGTAGGTIEYLTLNHQARCGYVNVFTWGTSGCIINNF